MVNFRPQSQRPTDVLMIIWQPPVPRECEWLLVITSMKLVAKRCMVLHWWVASRVVWWSVVCMEEAYLSANTQTTW